MRNSIIHILMVLIVASRALATPSAPTISGSVAHGQSVTLSGTGFGTKSPAAPLLWDSVDGMYGSIVEGAEVPVGGTNPWNASGGSGMENPSFTLTNARGKWSAKYTNRYSPSDVLNAVLGEKSWAACSGAQLYLSYWHYPHTTLRNPGFSNKILRLTDDGGWSGTVSTVLWDVGTENLFAWSASTGYVVDLFPGYGTNAQWNRVEVVVDNSTNPRPTLIASVNNVSEEGALQASSSIANIIGVFTIGADWTNEQNTTIPILDWGEIYIDNTLSRVEICNNPVKSSATHCEIQIPSEWSNTSITATVNQGSFADNSTAYLFVIDSTGAASATGQSVTFGSISAAQHAISRGVKVTGGVVR